MSVRVRTTLAAMAVVAVALAAVAFSLVALPRAALVEDLDATVRADAERVAFRIQAGLPSNVFPGGDERVVRVLEPADRPSDIPADVPFGDVVTREIEGDPFRVMWTEALTPDGRPRFVFVGAPLATVEDVVGTIRDILLVAVPLLVAVVGAAAWRLTGRALQPVERIRSEVAEISMHALDRRVPEPTTGDEVGRLARTMNAMLDRLQFSTARQRQFVADASHELRSPVATIRAQLEVALREPESTDWEATARRILAEDVRLQRLVDDLLTLARAEAPGVTAAQTVDLDELVLEDAERVRATGVAVDSSGVTGGRVTGDPHQLTSVVRNLLDNAARHARTAVRASVRKVGNDVVLTVSDDGPGIPPDQRAVVFERFSRLDDARTQDRGGGGLGLALVRAVVHAHRGTVAVTDRPGGGAMFEVRLPAAPR